MKQAGPILKPQKSKKRTEVKIKEGGIFIEGKVNTLTLQSLVTEGPLFMLA